MSKPRVISILLNLHKPFVRHPEASQALEEQWFFETLSDTCLPLLELFDRLDAEHIPFRMALALSPTLCHLLRDELLLERYLQFVDRQIEFGVQELDRSSSDPELHRLALEFYDRAVDKRVLFTERYEGNILKIFDYYQRKGRLELLTTAATYAFLPLYTGYPEAIQAQMEVAIASHRILFGRTPHGFWLPELGWSPEIDRYLRSYNFSYTIVDSHSLLLGEPGASRGSFYPVSTPTGVFALARDFYARRELEGLQDPLYRDYYRDAGYDLPAESVKSFLEPSGARKATGYKYWAVGDKSKNKQLYDPALARERAREHARSFLDSRMSRLTAAGEHQDGIPLSLCAYDGDSFGRFWYEGPDFLEALFREGAKQEGLQFMTPVEYLYKQDALGFETMMPEFSSWGTNGYAEMWLDASNDWLYRHAIRSLDRMIELAERFPDDSGLKERALNQAAREILLVQSSDWPKMLYEQKNSAYARNQIETALRNFTTIYEALGSSYISTEWLTTLERRHNIFPTINYRVFRRKH
ncbi:glycoside hydrolase, family 57 [Treponema primitia ZAS-2]|uniref:Glycoside hydrolase, family 57 n=1 Tax=Treponema primitia (strain ATCC BAA-887 / DSM 12427 / ZAS-2) TaxID=545694 RepID=F5YPC9_TREPZ|nr:1,4-alpha-glucan branching protein domain-containing protein [Treponema primitia]AEF86009.1 glycoside hydrolase, family 57 [Treponema primitia ZAS-2]